MKYPFEASMEELRGNISGFVQVICDSLESEFLTMPKGEGFVNYETFEKAYELLKRETEGFNNLGVAAVLKAIKAAPVTLCVVRAMLGFTPPEWAYVASQRSGVEISQGYARSLDRWCTGQALGADEPHANHGKARGSPRQGCLPTAQQGLPQDEAGRHPSTLQGRHGVRPDQPCLRGQTGLALSRPSL